MNARLAGPVAGLALGLAVAIAANLAYAVPRGGVAVGVGLICPLILPIVLYLRTTFIADNRWTRVLRELATVAVAGPAAAVSFVHTYELVSGAGEWQLLAVLAPLSSDGLAGMATLALHRIRSAKTPATDTTATPPRRARTVAEAITDTPRPQQPTTPPPATPPAEASKPSELSPKEWAIKNWPTTGAAVQLATGCSKGYAYRVVAEVREQAS